MTETKGCAACHGQAPHSLARLNQHALLISCQGCHIPEYGNNGPAVINWNWLLSGNSTPISLQKENLPAGQGVFLAEQVTPLYLWDDSSDLLYSRGTKIHPERTTLLLGPGPRTPASKIMPFTVQYGTQLYDTKYRYLISPKLPHEQAPYFKGADWNTVSSLGMNKLRLPYSGRYGFTTTVSLHRLNHGVVPVEEALDCMDCHGAKSRFDWQQLGYEMDPWSAGPKNMQPPVNESTPTEDLPPVREMVLPVTPAT